MLANRLSRSWSAALEQARRDVAIVAGRVRGRGPSPLVWSGAQQRGPRTTERETPPAASTGLTAAGNRSNARELGIARVVHETPAAVTLVLTRDDGEAFAFLPGQFFTLLVDHEGEIVPRNYSASNAPGTSELHLTVKNTGGRVSSRLHQARAGERLRVLGPFGSFVVSPSTDAVTPRRLVLVAGGAGITPLASIASAVLATERNAEIALVYANRREEDVIFAAELDALAREHGARLSLVHVLEHREGRLDRDVASRAFDALPLAAHADAQFYICGPDGMRDEVLAALSARGVANDALHIERFSIGPRPQAATSSAAIAASVAPGARPIAIRVKDRTHRTTALPGATVLEAGLAAGAPMPFSCAVGGCGACRVKLIEGSVELEEPNCLSDAERAAGWVLACVGRACGPCTVEVPEESL